MSVLDCISRAVMGGSGDCRLKFQRECHTRPGRKKIRTDSSHRWSYRPSLPASRPHYSFHPCSVLYVVQISTLTTTKSTNRSDQDTESPTDIPEQVYSRRSRGMDRHNGYIGRNITSEYSRGPVSVLAVCNKEIIQKSKKKNTSINPRSLVLFCR